MSDKKFFNPYKQEIGFITPNWLAERKEVSKSAKMCYGRLIQFAGRDGFCYPSQKTLGKELGMSKRTVARAINELVRLELIVVQSGHTGKSNIYQFVEHTWRIAWQKEHKFNTTPTKNGTPPLPKMAHQENQLRESVKRYKWGESENQSAPRLFSFFNRITNQSATENLCSNPVAHYLHHYICVFYPSVLNQKHPSIVDDQMERIIECFEVVDRHARGGLQGNYESTLEQFCVNPQIDTDYNVNSFAEYLARPIKNYLDSF